MTAPGRNSRDSLRLSGIYVAATFFAFFLEDDERSVTRLSAAFARPRDGESRRVHRNSYLTHGSCRFTMLGRQLLAQRDFVLSNENFAAARRIHRMEGNIARSRSIKVRVKTRGDGSFFFLFSPLRIATELARALLKLRVPFAYREYRKLVLFAIPSRNARAYETARR